MKIWTEGRHLWTRTIGSTVVGQGLDSLIFYPLAFLGAAGWTDELVIKVLLTQWALKVGWEALLTPVTYAVVGFLKRREGVDVFDSAHRFLAVRNQGLSIPPVQVACPKKGSIGTFTRRGIPNEVEWGEPLHPNFVRSRTSPRKRQPAIPSPKPFPYPQLEQAAQRRPVGVAAALIWGA